MSLLRFVPAAIIASMLAAATSMWVRKVTKASETAWIERWRATSLGSSHGHSTDDEASLMGPSVAMNPSPSSPSVLSTLFSFGASSC